MIVYVIRTVDGKYYSEGGYHEWDVDKAFLFRSYEAAEKIFNQYFSVGDASIVQGEVVLRNGYQLEDFEYE